ncbi:MAG: hypothetical protein ABJ310_10275, partial [Roseobacter sp.]
VGLRYQADGGAETSWAETFGDFAPYRRGQQARQDAEGVDASGGFAHRLRGLNYDNGIIAFSPRAGIAGLAN